MIIDTSAILAILLGEADAAHYEDAIAAAWPRRMSAVALLEAAMVRMRQTRTLQPNKESKIGLF